MTDSKRILVVDDERDLAELLVYHLSRAGYLTSVARTGRQALDMATAEAPDLVLLDIMLPELSGTEVASRLRTNPNTAAIPIIMLTAKGEEVDQIVGLTVGADDYIPKPFSIKVVLARIQAVLRRTSKPVEQRGLLSMGALTVDTNTHEASLHGETIKLTLTEFRLLTALLQASGRVLSRQALMARAMGPGVMVTERTIDVHMTAIRKKLGDHASLIKTVRGVGYRATPEEDAIAEEESAS
jgi:two-component system phosphate regulon response regulator PhoB